MDVQPHLVSQPHARPTTMHDCIETCLKCHQECMETLQYCVQRGGEHTDPHHIKLLQTCIEATYASARFMMLQSSYHQVMCEICAQIAMACAKSCEEFHDDAMADCALLCERTAESCQTMAGTRS